MFAIFVDQPWTFSSKLITFLIIFKLFTSPVTKAEENSARGKRAIGGESLDASNFVLYEDEITGMRFIEIPYVFMQQSLNDQRMWRTWSIVLMVMTTVFFGIFLTFLVHSFRTSTGPFSCLNNNINEYQSEDKMTSLNVTDYQPPAGSLVYDPMADSRQLFTMKSNVL